jgi:hypothetical protein
MAIDFPDTPLINDIFTIGDKSWQWTGVVWNAVDTVKNLQVAPSDEDTAYPKTLYVGVDFPPPISVQEGDLWSDVEDYSAETEFIFTGPDEPDNYGQNTLWIDTDEPELPLIYSDDEPPEYETVEGDFWVDTDDTFGTQFVQQVTEPSPEEAEFWVDLSSEEGVITYQDLFENGSGQISSIEDLPDPSLYPGMQAYVSSEKALYVASDGSWTKIFPNYDAEALLWMGL